MSKLKLDKFKNNTKNKIFVTIPAVVYVNKKLNATDKIVLSLIHGYKSTWNAIKTKTIAKYLNLKTTTINESVRKLRDLKLIEERYYLARRRVFRSLLPETNDARAIITSDVFTDPELTTTYKITIGVIIASSLGEENFLGGFNYNDIETLAKELNLSVSSVYRHLKVLLLAKVIDERNFGEYLIRPNTAYSDHHKANQLKKIHHQKLKEDMLNAPAVELTPEINRILDEIHASL